MFSQEVVKQLPADQRVTLAFDELSLDAALKRLGQYASIAYLTQPDAEQGQGTITQITVFPKGAGSVQYHPSPEQAEQMARPDAAGRKRQHQRRLHAHNRSRNFILILAVSGKKAIVPFEGRKA